LTALSGIAVGLALRVRLLREAVALAFDGAVDISVLAAGATLSSLMAAPSFPQLDVVLLDTFEDLEPLALRIAEVRRMRGDLLLVVFAVDEHETAVIDYLQAGAAGYIDQGSTGAEVLDTIRSVVRGEMPCSPVVAARLSARLRAFAPRDRRQAMARGDGPSRLTAREIEILVCLEEGLSNKQIALRLQVALPTVKNHVHSLLEKLEAPNRGQAVAEARRSRLLQPGRAYS
jgi:two-component system nitrate/nitrite response regulator NarL